VGGAERRDQEVGVLGHWGFVQSTLKWWISVIAGTSFFDADDSRVGNTPRDKGCVFNVEMSEGCHRIWIILSHEVVKIGSSTKLVPLRGSVTVTVPEETAKK
jgi:hypothetical protein